MNRRDFGHRVRLVLCGTLIAVCFAGAHALAQSAPAAPAAQTDIRDIRGPKPVPSILLPLVLAAAGALLIAGGYGAWRWKQRRAAQRVKLPFELALERLDAARASMRPDNARLFSIEVSDTVRGYIEQRFHAMAAHRTTHEFLHDLLGSSDALLAEHRTLLAHFLNLCDLAKFAGWQLSTQEMETMHSRARAFVLATGLGEDRKSVVETYVSLPAT
jgi:hypothetical protein